ncbi:MAG: FMN-binding protein [Elusimicrobia bacterium]|nr:FMN-binding protein [Elusimicrobiota bacterium]
MRSFSNKSFWAAVPALVASFSPVVAADFLTESDAQKALFPEGESFDRLPSPAVSSLAAASAAAGGGSWAVAPKIWTVKKGEELVGHVVIDQVIGKHDFITFGVGISSGGEVLGVEILSYREVYGGEVRTPRWRRQFVGKKTGDALRFPLDIKNISGATLSCRHVTDGVRRVLALMENRAS